MSPCFTTRASVQISVTSLPDSGPPHSLIKLFHSCGIDVALVRTDGTPHQIWFGLRFVRVKLEFFIPTVAKTLGHRQSADCCVFLCIIVRCLPYNKKWLEANVVVIEHYISRWIWIKSFLQDGEIAQHQVAEEEQVNLLNIWVFMSFS